MTTTRRGTRATPGRSAPDRDHGSLLEATSAERTVVELSLVWDSARDAAPSTRRSRRPTTAAAPWMVDIRLLEAVTDAGCRLRSFSPGVPVTDADIEELVMDAYAVVLAPQPIAVPSREGSAHDAARALAALLARTVPVAHVIVASTFLAGHSARHGSNQTPGLRGQREFESAVRANCTRWTIVRPTWLSDDPPGCHAIRLTQDPLADGMLAPGDFGTTIAAVIGNPRAWGRTFAAYNDPAREHTGLRPDAFDRLHLDFEATSR